jgi:tRNA (guanine37-N1)-methyltransferase
MQIDVLTLFPQMFAPMHESMMWKAQDRALLDLHLHDIRDWALGAHRSVDDTPYGGGGGMLLRADVLVPAVEAVRGDEACPVILMSPQGRKFDHDVALELSQHERLIFVCGHYEGFDERIRQLVITDEISIGDYVLTGGELAAMVIMDAVVRQLPGVLGAEHGTARDSYAHGLLEGAQYTRPAEYRGLGVPDILKSGNHAAIETWHRRQALARTWARRPDLLQHITLTKEESYMLAQLAHVQADAQADEQDNAPNIPNDTPTD